MNSTYNKELHVRVPTLDYLKAVTGYDLITEGGWTKEVTESKVLAMSIRARNYLQAGKNPRYQKAFNYLVATNDIWAEAWEQYVATYIAATFTYGDESAWEKTPRDILLAINGTVLQSKYFTERTYYQAENTTEVF